MPRNGRRPRRRPGLPDRPAARRFRLNRTNRPGKPGEPARRTRPRTWHTPAGVILVGAHRRLPRPLKLSWRTEVTYVIAEPCVDVLDRACVEECPVDCIYEGGRMLY